MRRVLPWIVVAIACAYALGFRDRACTPNVRQPSAAREVVDPRGTNVRLADHDY